jgi:hypothetical protein
VTKLPLSMTIRFGQQEIKERKNDNGLWFADQ